MKEYRAGIDIGSTTVKLVLLDDYDQIIYSKYRRHCAHTQDTLADLLQNAKDTIGNCYGKRCNQYKSDHGGKRGRE